MVYILSDIVDKFFFRRLILSIKEHPDFALFRTDHHRLAAHAAHHVKGIHRPAAQRQLQRILLHTLFQRLSQIVGNLEEPVGGTQPPDALVRPLVVVILDPEGGTFNRLLEAVKLRPLQVLVEDRLPEPLDLAKRHGVVRPGADMLDPVFFKLLFEPSLPPPVGVLPAVVGQHLPRNAVLGYPSTVDLKDVFGRLAAVQSQGGDVTAVIIDEADQIGVVAPQPEGHDVALPKLVGPRPLEEPRLGWVFLRFARSLVHQPPLEKRLVNRRRAGAHQKKPLQNIGDPPRTVLRMIRLDLHRLLPNLIGHAAFTAHGALWLQPLGSFQPVGSHPTMNRMRADTKLLAQQTSAVSFLQEKLHDPQPELHRIGQGPGPFLCSGCRLLVLCLHRAHSFLCKWFLHSGVSPNFLKSLVS